MHRFAALIDKAYDLIPTIDDLRDNQGEIVGDYGGATVIHIPSSPIGWDDKDNE